MAPISICPSMPMFHKPAVKVNIRPIEASTRGTHACSTCVTASVELKAPEKMTSKTLKGFALMIKMTRQVNTSAKTTAMNNELTRFVRRFKKNELRLGFDFCSLDIIDNPSFSLIPTFTANQLSQLIDGHL